MAKNKVYYKITNEKENHHGFQYRNGLNVLQGKFNDNPNHCGAGGFYFTDIEHIFDYVYLGIYVREVTLPVNNPNFRMIKDKDKYRANMIILGKKYELAKVETIKMLIEKGAIMNNDYMVMYSAKYGHSEVLKYLIESGANIHVYDDALYKSAKYGHLAVVKCLIEAGVDIHIYNDQALHLSAKYGHLDLVKYLLESNANIHAMNDLALKWAVYYGHLDVVKYLVVVGADVFAVINNNTIFTYCTNMYNSKRPYREIINYLLDFGDEILGRKKL